jgi:hypothetical protein
MKKLLAMSLLLVSSLSYAFTGNELLDALGNKDDFERGAAKGFIVGYVQAADGSSFCRPEKVTNGQIFDLVKNTLVASPALRHDDASVFIMYTMMQHFPCAKKPSNGKV